MSIQRNIDAQFHVTIPNVQPGRPLPCTPMPDTVAVHIQHRDFPPKTMPSTDELREASFDMMLEPLRVAFHKMAVEFNDLMDQLRVGQAAERTRRLEQEQLRADVMRACAGNRRRQKRRLK